MPWGTKNIEKTIVSASKINLRASRGGLGDALGGLEAPWETLGPIWGTPWGILLGEPWVFQGEKHVEEAPESTLARKVAKTLRPISF